MITFRQLCALFFFRLRLRLCVYRDTAPDHARELRHKLSFVGDFYADVKCLTLCEPARPACFQKENGCGI